MPFLYNATRRSARLRSSRGRASRRGKYLNSIPTAKGYKKAKKFIPRTKPFSTVNAGTTVSGGSLVNRSFLPQTMITQHRYVEQVTLTAEGVSGLTGNEVAFRLNSLYDPNFSLVGHQPYGYDQMGQLYQKYCVYKVHMQVRVQNQTSNQPECCINVRPFNNGAYTLTNKKPWEEMERPGNVVITCNGELKTWDQTIYIADIEGVPRSKVFDEDNFSAVVGNSPTRSPYFSVACGSSSGSTPSDITITVAFVFHTVWSSPNAGLARS